MKIVDRTTNFVVAALKSYGPASIKKILWDKEFAGTKWDFMDDTSSDCVYKHLEQYAKGGSVLDLGCGPGNTANEMAESCYQRYIGVDISQAAVDKGIRRTNATGREKKNSFIVSDFLGFTPTEKFDVILFRESMYHIPYGQVGTILAKFSSYLKPDGVFIVRLYACDIATGVVKPRVTAKMDLIKKEYDVFETAEYPNPGKPIIMVFRPRPAAVQ
jgi:SAM-dependent methyltransferase